MANYSGSAEQIVQASAPKLPRILTLRDLVLFNLVAVTGISWVATAAKAGPGTLTLWGLAAVLFFIPQGLAVIQLSRDFPDEGGIYAWTKREFGELQGFICGWCYWINNMLYYPTLLLSAAVNATFIFGKGETGLGHDWHYVLPFTFICLAIAVVLNVVGAGTGRWLQNIGGYGVYLPGLLLLCLGCYAVFTQPAANSIGLAQLKPDVTNLPMLNLWATIAFAFSGLELSSTMGHEVHLPRRNLPRSIYITAPLVAGLYICGTAVMLYLIPKDQINVVAGPLQGIASGTRNLGSAWWWIVPVAALCLTISGVGGVGAWLTGSARVAFVVGLDRYFPSSFGRVHPRWQTPYVAILVQVPLALLFLVLSVLGKGTTVERAFLMLLDMSLLIYFIPYIYLFVCFAVHCYRTDQALVVPGGVAPAFIVALSGAAVTLIAMILAIIPPAGTADIGVFEAKLVGGSIFLVLLGLFIYWRSKQERYRST